MPSTQAMTNPKMWRWKPRKPLTDGYAASMKSAAPANAQTATAAVRRLIH